MCSLTIDKTVEITELKKRHSELSVLRAEPPGPFLQKTKQKLRITSWMQEIDTQILDLRLSIVEQSASTVVVSRPKQEDIDAIETALTNVHKKIKKDQNFNQILKNVTTLLEAAHTINAAVS